MRPNSVSYHLPAHQRLSNALLNDEFRVHYQPLVELATGRVIGAEALLRWPGRDASYASPETFIPQAEQSGVIMQLGDFALRTAADQMRRWHETFGIPLRIAVNLSGRQFLHYNLIESIRNALNAARLEPAFVEFEITESVAMHDAEESIGIMRQLKSLGMQIALDDFGTGYSSLAYLKRLPIDKLKIDKSFVRDIPEDANDLAIVSAVVVMAHALGLTVLAEGVETQAQAEFLRESGCEYAQGFLFGRALPPEEFEALLATVAAAPAC